MKVYQATRDQLDEISLVYGSCFSNERIHSVWIESSFNSFPRAVYYVIEIEHVIVGYILWAVKNGFRDACIAELEQLAVMPNNRGKGLARALIAQSFLLFQQHVVNAGFKVGSVIVTTTEGNSAEKLYINTLDVKNVAVLKGYGDANEIILYKKL